MKRRFCKLTARISISLLLSFLLVVIAACSSSPTPQSGLPAENAGRESVTDEPPSPSNLEGGGLSDRNAEGNPEGQNTAEKAMEAPSIDVGQDVALQPETDAAGNDTEPEDKQVSLAIETVASRLTVPWGLDFAEDGTLFFTERPGRIRMLPPDGPLSTLAVLEDTAAVGEGGLLGLALHPEFPRKPHVYVYQTYQTGSGLANRILRFRFDSEEGARLADREILLDNIPGNSIHNGGALLFGPDGRLYASTGDANQASHAQDSSLLNGKILRLEPDGGIPRDNPFGGGNPVFSYGHRNPEGLAFSPDNGLLYGTEHGSTGLDEVNLIQAGANYGWPDVRGMDHGSRTGPLRAFDPTTPPAGADFYEGPIIQWRGSLFFGTLGFDASGAARHLHRIKFAPDGGTIEEEEVLFKGEYGRIRSVRLGTDGCLYMGTSNRDGRGDPAGEDDRILRICAGE